MRKINKILTLSLASLLVACGSNSNTKVIMPDNGANNYVRESEESIGNTYLNLTSIGLYNGQKGIHIEDSNIEYGVVLENLNVGDALPSSEITSTSKDVSFYKWCYYVSGGKLEYTTSVVEGINLYQAVYKYSGNYDFSKPSSSSTEDSSSSSSSISSSTTSSSSSSTSSVISSSSSSSSENISSSSSSTSEVESNVVRYYFIDQSWWNDAAAESWVYIWNSTLESDNYKLAWPGEMMTHVNYDSETKQNTWYIDIDLDLYDRCVVSRQKTQEDGSVSSWGAQTVDITLSKEFNTITLCSDASWGTATVTTSYIER